MSVFSCNPLMLSIRLKILCCSCHPIHGHVDVCLCLCVCLEWTGVGIHEQLSFDRVRTPPGKSWIFCKIFRPWKVLKMGLVLESPGHLVQGPGIF